MANPARPWRLALTEAEQATVLAAMAAHDARVLRNQPRPPWQPTTSTTMEARSLESCERTLILAMNRPDPPRSETLEQVYADVRAGEAMFGDDGRDVRLERLRWEIQRFRQASMERRPHPAAPLRQAGSTAGRAGVPSSPLRADAPLTGRPHVTSAPPSPPAAAPPDTFHDAVAPHDAMERELAAELAHAMRQISTLPLAESARASLDTELRNARSAAERLQVLR